MDPPSRRRRAPGVILAAKSARCARLRKVALNRLGSYQPESYGDGVFHSLEAGSPEHCEQGDTVHVYEISRTMQASIDQRSREPLLLAHTRKYLQYGWLSLGFRAISTAPHQPRWK